VRRQQTGSKQGVTMDGQTHQNGHERTGLVTALLWASVLPMRKSQERALPGLICCGCSCGLGQENFSSRSFAG